MNDTEMLETASRLKTLTLCRLSELERVWAENWQGVLFFRNLQEVSVSDCEKLQTLFPASLAKDLQKLEKLVVKRCVNLQEIVEKKEGTAAITTENFVFPRLEKLNLDDLPEVTYFYPQTFTLECPILSNLSILDCTKLELFQSLVTLNLDKCILPHASPSVIFPYLKNLEELKVQGNDKVKVVFDMNDTEMLETASRLKILTLCRLSELEHVWAKNWPGVLFFRNLQEVSVSDCEKLQTLFPASLAKDLQKLEKLVVKRCVNLQEIVEKKEGIAATTTENFVFPHLEKLDLDDLPEVTYFYPQMFTLECPILSNLSILDCTKLELFQSLVTLNLDKCILPHAIPSVIFPYLKNLEELKVQGNDKVKVVFDMNDTEMLETASQLKILTLCRLSELERVWAENWQGVVFFQNLQEVSVSDCEKLQTLFPASLAKDLQKLEKLVVYRCVNLQAIVEKKEGTAATTTENFVFPRLEKLDLDDLPEVTYFYPQMFTLECPILSNLSILDCTKLELFQSLVILNLDKCILPHAIPSVIFPYLKNLEELKVQGNDKVKVVFDMNDTEMLETASRLKILTLCRLSELERVWAKNWQGVLFFRNLQEVSVSDCEKLQTLFPASLAKDLQKLEKLVVNRCVNLQAIVEKKEGTAATTTENFIFPRLEKLDLDDLPEVTYFYPQTFTLECPTLSNLSILDCTKLELFQSAHPTAESSSSNIQSHMSNLKSLSNVKELTLDWKHISALNLWFKSEQCQEGLDYLEEIVLYFDADENEKAMLPIEILQKAPNLTHLDIGFCKSSKTFFAENPEIDVGRMLGQLTILTLDEVSMLQSIVSKNSLWLNTICEKLHELNVYSCPHLMTLVHSPSRVSFSCLKQVSIIRCPNLHNLFTSSAAKKLINLENITVKHCQSVMKIVANERDENEHKGEGEDELIFGKLEILKLVSLPKFESFYTGRSTLNFPSFKDVRFTNCDSTKIFRLGDKVPATLKVEIDGDYWKGDINSVIMKQLEE
ncbi:hypothetical protein Fmac_010341 [Flemingia macrophylla]|uniref:Disease resistance protein At4g27190-like leucine-rich repeats domain-containing protein n=1 Tax=Flemingia macrophylla TaxID=520843 RepID=A0ABD1MJA4_9FABA